MGNDSTPGKSAATPATPAKPPAAPAGGAVGKSTQVQAGGLHMGPGGIMLPSVLQQDQAPPVDLTVHAPEEMGDAIAKFRIALDKNDAEGAQRAWSFAKPEEKQAFGKGASINRELQQVARVTGPLTIHVMAEAGLDFAGRTDLIDYMLKIGFPHWFDSIDEVGGTLMATFLDNLPHRDALDDKALAKLDRIINGMNSLAVLKPLFERVYVPLSDTSYDPTSLRTGSWQADTIHKLYRTLREHLPTAHVRTVRSFHIGKETKEGGEWKKLTYAWWDADGYVVFPEGSATDKDGGGRDHRMTGGEYAHADPKTGKGKVQGAMDHFDVGALHEVGHAVGDAMGGHQWAQTYAYVGWQTNMNIDAWSKGLWGNDVALTVRAKHRAGDGKVVSSADARHWLANDMLDNETMNPDWLNPTKLKEAILKQYGDQPLVDYYKKCKASDDKRDWYKFSGNQNYGTDGRVYVYCDRGGSNYTSYNQKAHKEMVSWYSMSSPHEWFAEQYAHYYRLGKSGLGLEGGVAKKLAELDAQQPPAKAAAPAAPAPGGAPKPAEKFDGEGNAKRRVPFPW